MIGVDLGLNVGSITRIDKDGRVRDSLVLKFEKKGQEDDHARCEVTAIRFANQIAAMAQRAGVKQIVVIEEPIFSWGRKNPKGFAKNVALITLVQSRLAVYRGQVKRIKTINNKTAKRLAGGGGKDKTEMIAAFKKKTGNFPGHSTKYGQETLADSYFIALAGYES